MNDFWKQFCTTGATLIAIAALAFVGIRLQREVIRHYARQVVREEIAAWEDASWARIPDASERMAEK